MLIKNNQNLRDHMTDWELILSLMGEKPTTDITIDNDSKGFDQCKTSANKGGTISKNTKKELEKEIGKPVMSKSNYLYWEKRKS